MKIKEGFVIREVAGQSVVIALGAAAKSYNGMIRLNDTAKLIWQCLEKGQDKDAIVDAILSEYDVDRELAENDFDKFINALIGANIIE
ncbi:MAG: PqqD family protein [Clostridia bacterium]|nr:PqqD family protein [Clostridia bacterium]